MYIRVAPARQYVGSTAIHLATLLHHCKDRAPDEMSALCPGGNSGPTGAQVVDDGKLSVLCLSLLILFSAQAEIVVPLVVVVLK